MLQFTTTDNVKLAYYVDDFTDPWQKAPTLLLLHSAMAHAARLYAWVPKLARHYRVVRLDMRGHGASEVPSPQSELTMERLVKDVAELLDHLGCESVHIAGNSAGGYVAQHLAMTRPERVRSLALFAAGTGLRHTQATGWLEKVEKEGLRPFLARTIADRFPSGTNPKLVEWFLDEAAKNNVPFIARFIGLMTTLEWSDSLHLIRCPTLVVCPGAETIGSQNDYDRMKESIPECTLISYEGMPHNIVDTVPDRCVEDVLAFLRWHFGQP